MVVPCALRVIRGAPIACAAVYVTVSPSDPQGRLPIYRTLRALALRALWSERPRREAGKPHVAPRSAPPKTGKMENCRMAIGVHRRAPSFVLRRLGDALFGNQPSTIRAKSGGLGPPVT